MTLIITHLNNDQSIKHFEYSTDKVKQSMKTSSDKDPIPSAFVIQSDQHIFRAICFFKIPALTTKYQDSMGKRGIWDCDRLITNVEYYMTCVCIWEMGL